MGSTLALVANQQDQFGAGTASTRCGHDTSPADAPGDRARFRQELYACRSRRADVLFEPTDAVLCAEGPVRSLVELSLVGEHRRGHGGSYAGLTHGRLDSDRLRRAVITGPLPRAANGRLVPAVDITCWLRPEAHTAPGPTCAIPMGAVVTST